MKNIYLPILLCAFCAPLFAQVQTGMVREQNSNKRPIGGVQITFNDAVPTTSDDAGNFRLAFQGKKAGDLIFFSEIKKAGYEIVNAKDFQILKVSSTSRLGEDIILAKAGALDAAKKEYYGISDKALQASFNKERKNLQAQLQQAQLNQKQYEDQITALQEQYERQKASLDALADQFARVNFDDVENLYREALELFKAGDIDGCKKKLEGANLLERTSLRLQERKRIAGSEAVIAQQKADNEKGIQEDIKALKLQTQTYLLTFEFAKAEAIYDQLLLLDATNLDILQEAADFYRKQHRYDKAKQTYPKIIAHPQAEDWQKANAYTSMGDLHTATGSLPDALDAYTKYFETYQKLYKSAPSNTFYQNNLAISYSRLGVTHTELGNLDKALTFYEQFNKLSKELYAAYPQNVEFKRGLAVSYEKLGNTHTALGNLDKALTFYEQSNKLSKELYAAYPQNVEFKYGLAVSYFKLGQTHKALGNLDKALTFFEKDTELSKELYVANPQNVEFKNNLAYSYDELGTFYRDQKGDKPKAKGYFQQCYMLWKELSEAYPSYAEFRNNFESAKKALEGL